MSLLTPFRQSFDALVQAFVRQDDLTLLARNVCDVIVRHSVDGEVLFASAAAEPVFGVPSSALLGRGLLQRLHASDRMRFVDTLARAAATSESESGEFRFVRAAGVCDDDGDADLIWIEMRCRPLAQADGRRDEAPDLVAVLRDVSERKRQERALESARNDAERANAAKSRFLAVMSHELRTPLNVIIGFSEMLTRSELMPIDAVRQRDYAQLIHESGQHLLSVVNGILDMSKIESGTFEIVPEPLALDRALATACDLMTLKAREASIELARRISPDLPEIVADKRALNQVLLNLLSNALKFTDRGGRVTVTSFRDGAAVAVVVEDSGIGIAADDLPQIGHPFFQAGPAYDRRHGGTGLGLSIVKGLVELHGGTFTLRSRLGVGTTATVRLPINCEATADMPLPASTTTHVLDFAIGDEAVVPMRKIA